MGNYDGMPREGEIEEGGQQSGESGALPPETGVDQPGASGGGQQPTQPAPQGQFNGSEWGLKYRGQPYVPKDRQELVNLAQKGFSYTQEMERINRERREWQQRIDDMQSKYRHYDDIDSLMKKNPAFSERMMQLAQEFQTGGQQDGQQPANGVNYQLYNGLVTRLGELEKLNTERINKEYDRQLADQVSKMRATYAGHDWDFDDGTGNLEKKVIQFAYENGISNLDYAYRAMMFDQNGTNAKAAALKKEAEARAKAQKAGVISQGAAGGSAPAEGYKYGDSYKSLADKMKAEMKS
jgi:hypothetical protein